MMKLKLCFYNYSSICDYNKEKKLNFMQNAHDIKSMYTFSVKE